MLFRRGQERDPVHGSAAVRAVRQGGRGQEHTHPVPGGGLQGRSRRPRAGQDGAG